MKKVRLNENDIERLVKKIIKEELDEGFFSDVGDKIDNGVDKVKGMFKGDDEGKEVANFIKEKFVAMFQNNGVKLSKEPEILIKWGKAVIRFYPKTSTDFQSIHSSLENSFPNNQKPFKFKGGEFIISYSTKGDTITVSFL